jgi:hypothetical protein
MESKYKIIIGSFGLLTLLLLLTPFADSNPDGLESAAGEFAPEGSVFNLGFLTDYGAEDSVLYKILGNESLSVIISGFIGLVIIISIFFIPLLLKRKKKTDKSIQ